MYMLVTQREMIFKIVTNTINNACVSIYIAKEVFNL